MKKTYLCAGIMLSVFSGASLAHNHYILTPELSSLGFTTIKNQFVVEPATITSLSGTVDEHGEFDISVDLKGIKTGIPIRDSRLNDIFFESSKYSSAKVSGKVDWSVLKEGAHKINVPTNVTLFGKTIPISFPVVILKTDDVVMVSSSAPVIIGAKEFGIPSENLTKLAATVGGIKISDRVPLTLNLTFKKSH